jgi:hypothetical protein
MKNMRINFSWQNKAFIISLLLIALEVFAHHGWSYYQDEISMDLTVLELRLRNPHDHIIAIDKKLYFNKKKTLLTATRFEPNSLKEIS